MTAMLLKEYLVKPYPLQIIQNLACRTYYLCSVSLSILVTHLSPLVKDRLETLVYREYYAYQMVYLFALLTFH